MRFQLVVLATLLSFTAACTTNPYTNEEEASKAGIGATIGAISGALLGAAIGGGDAKDRRKRALIGAGVGGLAGGGVGYYMDRQEAKLREELRGTGVSVTREGENIRLNMPGNITFKTGSPELNPDFFRVLHSVALVLKEYDKTLAVVAGHTDNVGGKDFNQKLSEERSSTVATYLSSQGIPGGRLMAVGFGEEKPIATNATPEGRAQNRRVELTLEPLKQS